MVEGGEKSEVASGGAGRDGRREEEEEGSEVCSG